MRKICTLSLLWQLFIFASISHATSIKPEIIEKAQNSVVTIEARISTSAYSDVGSYSGTGFVHNIKKGFIITNRHVAGGPNIGNYLVTFFNGQKVEAKVKYYDGWQDFAVLQVDPDQIPQDVKEIKFSAKKAKQNQSVFIIGNNEGQSFSFHEGYLANAFYINGAMPQHTYIINLNATGGSSGSPLLNEDGDAIGLNYGGGQTYGLALHGDYIQDVMSSLEGGKNPARKHIGVVCSLYSLDQAVRHRNFPEGLIKPYLKEFPETKNNAIIVQSVLPGSPAFSKIESGDIIWEANGKKVGASLYDFDKAMNQSNDKIQLLVYRNGEKLNITVDLYNVDSNKIGKMVEFGGAIFFEADDFFTHKTGIALKSLAVDNINQGMSMSVIPTKWAAGNKALYRILPLKIANKAVGNLAEFTSVIKQLGDKKFTTINFQNYQPYYQGFGDIIISNHETLTTDITLDNVDFTPRIFEFESKELNWKVIDLKTN